MKVSIATISFNQAAFLEAAITSVLTQEYPDVEYIIIDPGSSDGSREIIERYRSQITHVLLEPDLGPADGLNRCFSKATGDVFGYLNADDVLMPHAIREAVFALSETKADVVYGDGVIIDENSRRLRRCISTPFNLRRYLLGSVLVLQQSTFFKAEAFRMSKGFNSENRTCWDYELIYDLAALGKSVKHIPRYWSMFRIHARSITGSKSNQIRYEADRQRIGRASLERYGRLLGIMKLAARIERYLIDPRSIFLRIVDCLR